MSSGGGTHTCDHTMMMIMIGSGDDGGQVGIGRKLGQRIRRVMSVDSLDYCFPCCLLINRTRR